MIGSGDGVTMHIIVILALGIVAWAAAEWMFFKEVARTWRDSKLKRSAKICAVVMACIDIPLAWLSPFAAILLVAGFRTPNGYCLHFANYHGDVLSDALSMVYTLLLAPVLAPFAGIGVGWAAVEIFDFETCAGAGGFAAEFAVKVFFSRNGVLSPCRRNLARQDRVARFGSLEMESDLDIFRNILAIGVLDSTIEGCRSDR